MGRKAVSTGVGGIFLAVMMASALAQGQGRAEQLRAPQADSVCLNEFLPKPFCSSQMGLADRLSSFAEFIELYNYGGLPVDIGGWKLQVSAGGSLTIAQGTRIEASGFWVTYALGIPDRSATIFLLNDSGGNVDQHTYSSSRCSLSIGRCSDGESRWCSNLAPSPGRANTFSSPSPARSATPTFTRTSTPSPTHTRTPNNTPAPSATKRPTRDPRVIICLSEFMPAPHDVDWDGDGVANYKDEWIELHNASAEEVDLWGWMLDDQAGGGTDPYTFPAGSRIPAGGFRAFYLRQTGVILNNSGGDEVRLLAPEGTVVDLASYEETTYDVSYSRVGGCGGEWVTGLPPSPGEANPIPTATPTLASVPLYLPLLQRPRS